MSIDVKFTWGPVPKPQEFHAIGKKMKFKNRRRQQSITPITPSFLCPTQALGFALQHHPILLVGSLIIEVMKFVKDSSQIFFKKPTLKLYNNIIIIP
jgi:hypothetical protein